MAAALNLLKDKLPHEAAGGFDRFNDALGCNVYKVDWEALKEDVLKSKKVQRVFDKELERKGKAARRAMIAHAKSIVAGLTSGFSSYTVSALGTLCDVLAPQLYRGVYMEPKDYERLRSLARGAEAAKSSLIFLPSHKSHVDYIALQYMLHRVGVSPASIAAGDNLNIPGVGGILSRVGAFFIRRSFGGADGELYCALVAAYLQELMKRGVNIEFFPEGGRSRAGKLLQPKIGLLGMITSHILQDEVQDAVIIPVSVQYDKLMEGGDYAKELLGAKKQKESVTGLMNQTHKLLGSRHDLGGIHVRIGDGFSLREYIMTYTARRSLDYRSLLPARKVALFKSVAYKVMDNMNHVSVVTATGIIATVMLTARGRGVGRTELIAKCEWLRDEIVRNGGRVFWPSAVPSKVVVDNALALLGDYLSSERLLEPIYSVKNHLQLSFYRNTLVHIFVEKAIVAAALHSVMREDATKRSVSRAELLRRTGVLSNLLKTEFVYRAGTLPEAQPSVEQRVPATAPTPCPAEGAKQELPNPPKGVESQLLKNFNIATDAMVASKALILDPSNPDEILLFSTDPELWSQEFTFLCMLVWPYIESYWLCIAGVLGVFTPKLAAGPGEAEEEDKPHNHREKQVDRLVREETFMRQLQTFGLNLFHLGNLTFFEAISAEYLKHAVATYIDFGAVRRRNVVDITKTSTAYIELGNEHKVDIQRLYALEEQVKTFRRQGKCQSETQSFPSHLARLAFRSKM
eukprot:TRINITY_DN25058_c0_g1_i1.p1 TRINITY_DN25058_c0_g1~~TRINITY_DN25058_c0_g1_i1.p1  ORF type:complete len:744 (+),score=249.80 TRINITY_DN25058_c0_g1_i1:73-2304(+)